MQHIEHAPGKRLDTRSVRPCQYCRDLDPGFGGRMLLDQMVLPNHSYTASAHLSEEGYVRHRMLELKQRLERQPQTAA